MYCFNCTDFHTIYYYTSITYPCEALAVFKLSAKCRQCRQNLYFAKKKNTVKPLILQCFLSGDGGIRTHDLYTASVALSQLSYAPNPRFDWNLNYNTGNPDKFQHLFWANLVIFLFYFSFLFFSKSQNHPFWKNRRIIIHSSLQISESKVRLYIGLLVHMIKRLR